MPKKTPQERDPVASRIHVRIDPALGRAVRVRCAETGIRLQDAVTEALKTWLRGGRR